MPTDRHPERRHTPMRKLIAALALTAATVAAAPHAAATDYDPEPFATKYVCVSTYGGGWIDGLTQALWTPRTIKTSVYATAGDGTALVRKGTNHATAAAIASTSSLRYVCMKRVPFGTRVRFS